VDHEGKGFCFSCNKNQRGRFDTTGVPIINSEDVPITVSRPSVPDTMEYTYQYLPWRGVSKETMQFYNVQTKVDTFGKPVSLGYPYTPENIKVRSLDAKSFFSVGDMSNAPLFGQDKFSAGSARAVTLVEGELDALSAYQMLGSKYPVVSVRSASSARNDCTRARDWLNSFEKIYLAFDHDEHGEKATREVAALFDFNKVYHVKLSQFKDANDYLQNGKEGDFKAIWYNSRRFLPEGIISSQSEFDDIIDHDDVKEGVPYPFPTLHKLTYGIRTSEATLFTALEGIGKTEILRAIEYHLLRYTDSNVGIIHLEEGKGRSLKGLAGYHLRTPAHLPDTGVSKDQIKTALKDLLKRDDRLHVYSHFGSDDPDVILDTVRFLATACNCKYIFLDHISMVVSGLKTDDERKVLDYISTRLATMVEELDFALIFVSHVNDDGLTRGSRNISKTAHTWIHIDRDNQAPTEEERDTSYLTIRKNRFGSRTGPAGRLYFDPSTFIVEEKDVAHVRLPPVNTPSA
jgi:twinkle protein